VRNDEKPFRAGSSNSSRFRAWANRSYPEGKRLLLCVSTGWTARAVLQNRIGQTKDAERRDKVSVRTGKKPGDGKRPMQTSKTPAALKTTPLACERKAT
jgi:hypothetical protein